MSVRPSFSNSSEIKMVCHRLEQARAIVITMPPGGDVPQEWKYATNMALHKKSRTGGRNYRSVMLVAHAGKALLVVTAREMPANRRISCQKSSAASNRSGQRSMQSPCSGDFTNWREKTTILTFASPTSSKRTVQ